LRTPITPALMAATALEKDASLPEAARSDIALIRRNIEFEARLIDDLLDLTLITHGKLTLSIEEMNVHAVLNRALEACQGEARQKNLKLQIDLGAAHSTIMGDPVRLQQVFWNVLRNAVKFTPSGGRIAIATGNDQGAHVWIRVTDSGVGFAPELAEHIFQPFQPANRGMNRPYGGLGLGLAISRSIMSAHQGNLIAESSGPGHGAMFLMELPLQSATTKPAGPAPAPTPAPPLRGIRILLVEDHDDTRACIQQLLESAGHRVSSAGTANAALELAESARFDLVISDLGLPDLTGHDLMRELHQHYGLGGIALSGYGSEEDVAQSRASGFQHHLTKPVSFDRLRTLVAEFAGKNK
jgi:CheY-like chemotaxis protein